MILGPVFRAELIRTARRKRYYVLRIVYGLALLFFLGQQYLRLQDEAQFRPILIKDMANFGQACFWTFAVTQFVAILLLVPALVGGTIADEKQRNTLHYLMASQLSSAEIVFDKLVARLLHLGVFVALGAPILCMLSFFGGVSPEYILVAYALTASAAFLAASLSMLVSVLARRVRQAVIIAYVVEGAWLIWPFVVIFLGFIVRQYLNDHFYQFLTLVTVFYDLDTSVDWLGLGVGLASTSPLALYFFMPNMMSRGPGRPRGLVGPAALPGMIGALLTFQVVVGLIVLLLAIWLLRRTYKRQQEQARRLDWFGPKVRRPRWMNRPACGDDAVLWKERWFARADVVTKMFVLPATVLVTVGLILGSGIDETALQAFRDVWHRGWVAIAQGQEMFHASLCKVSTYYIALWLLAVASSSATCVTSEREGDTWISLISTPMSGRDILVGKLLGAIWNQRGFAAMLGLLWLAGLLTGAVHPVGLLTGLLVLGLLTWFVAALGTYFSLRARTTSQALAGTLATLFFLNVGYLAAAGWMLDTYPELVMGVTPYAAAHSLFSYHEVRDFFGRILPLPLPRLIYEARYLAVGASVLTIHAGAATLLTFRTIVRFDKIIGRPEPALLLPEPLRTISAEKPPKAHGKREVPVGRR